MPAERPQSRWTLSGTGEAPSREELLARYRSQRALPEDPFENGVRPVPPPGYRDRIMTKPRPVHFLERQAAETPPQRSSRSFTLGQTFAIAAAMALMAGGAGIIGARLSSTAKTAAAPVLAPAPEAEAAAPQLNERQADTRPQQLQLAQAGAAAGPAPQRKPISTATLQVADVTGETNSFIPLALHAAPGGAEKDMLLKISGVPDGAYLTSGHRQQDQVWALSLAETKDVKLVVPRASQPQIDLAVAAIEPGTGELAAPVKTMTVALKDVVVEPASAPPPDLTATPTVAGKSTLPGANIAGPTPIPSPKSVKLELAVPETAQTQQLITAADKLFGAGDVKAARRSYERAWGNDGSAAAAFGLARSYDPLVLASLAQNNATADRAQAIRWYQRAASGGNPNAAEAIVRLQLKP